MDHLDLAGIMTTPPQWNTPVFDQQDAIYLSSSRQMLEPIMEETSEDEEYALNSWGQYDSQLSDSGGGAESICSGNGIESSSNGRATAGETSLWSSAESDTGSVIRVEVTKDNDCNSERDFLCPAKRARRCEDNLVSTANEEEVVLRRPLFADLKNNSLERFLNYENFSRDSWGANSQNRNSTGTNRRTAGAFDDFFSDSDSLSYNSLSRSSSLIQFESLERQLLQEQHNSMNSLGNSSPSLLSFDAQNSEEANKQTTSSANNSGNNSRRGSQSSLLKKYESLDGRLHQTYYDLDKLNFDDMEAKTNTETFGGRPANLKLTTHLVELRSDSESSSEGSDNSSRPQSVLSPCDSVDNELLKKFQRHNAQQNKKGISSAENLSEDSGYCEPSLGFGLRKSKSQNLCKNYEKFSEEDEEMDCKIMEHKSLVSSREEQTMGKEMNEDLLAKHSKEFKNTSSNFYENVLDTPPTSPLLDYMRHQQRSATHSPSPVSSEVSTASSKNSAASSLCSIQSAGSSVISTNSKLSIKSGSSCASGASSSASSASSSSSSAASSSTASSSSSATTCASKASFTWLMPSTTNSLRANEHEENPLPISLNDQRERKTSSKHEDAKIHNPENHNHQPTPPHPPQLLNNKPKTPPLFVQTKIKNENVFEIEAKEKCLTTNQTKFYENCENFYSKNFENYENNANKNFQFLDNCVYKSQQKRQNHLHNFENFSLPNLHCVAPITTITTTTPTPPHYRQTSVNKKYLESDLDAVLLNESLTHWGGEYECGEFQQNLRESEKEILIQKSPKNSAPHPNYLIRFNLDSPERLQHFETLMQNWPEKTTSVPSELNKVGRKKKYKKSRNKNSNQNFNKDLESSSENNEEEETAKSLPYIKRSSSWCFESQTHNFDLPLIARENKNLAILHQSYHNLALLDLDLNTPPNPEFISILDTEKNQKSEISHTMAERRLSADLESDYVCKNNFLLDELSGLYDKTASILNDRPISEDEPDHIAQKLACTPRKKDKQTEEPPVKPKPPMRRRSSNSSFSEKSDTDNEDQVQHVQLVIRKPPARQKRQQPQVKEKSNSLTQDFTFSAIMQAKTFDQDPTILKTSYAQSLEKCNFDCNELSQQDLTRARTMPKRRFHSQASQAKKRNMVSSTPNLNEFQKDDEEIEDDIFVSSAHTSMHQLAESQQQKPLGILLPAGSRTSFGKEVSFCPVVSKYSWQEQSSEECPDGMEFNTEQEGGYNSILGESDDELLDNCDADVIKNTKENENIGNFYREKGEEEFKREQEDNFEQLGNEELLMKENYVKVIKEISERSNDGKEQERENVREIPREENDLRVSTEEHDNLGNAMEFNERQEESETTHILPLTITQTTMLEDQHEHQHHYDYDNSNERNENETECETPIVAKATFSLKTNVNNETLTCNAVEQEEKNSKQITSFQYESQQQQQELEDKSHNNNKQRIKPKPTIVIARPISIQLPILSEPPINRAHHILYASQQMLDNFQRHQESEDYEHYKSQSVQNLNRMSDNRSMNKNGNTTNSAGGNAAVNNNNEVMKSKFKADEKHPNSKGFLSRFANNFRFSMRRNKKKLPNKEQQVATNNESNQTPVAATQSTSKKSNGILSKSKSKNTEKSSTSKQQQPDYIYIPLKGPLPEKYETGFFESHQALNEINSNVPVQANVNGNATNANATVSSKKVSAKKTTKIEDDNKVITGKPPIPPQQQQQINLQRTQSANAGQIQPQQVPQILVGHSRFYTHELGEITPQQTADTVAPNATQEFLSSERQHTAAQQQSFNNNETNNIVDANDMTSYEYGAAGSPSRASVSQKTQMFNNLSSRNSALEPKIGLIETNLDTHETVITGKTRSLINIGPNQQQQQQGNRFAGTKRLHHHNIGGDGQHHHHVGSPDDNGDYYDDNDDDEVVVRPDGSVVVIKNAGSNGGTASQAQIASVRRPHKSMEFLLDKENQKDVMANLSIAELRQWTTIDDGCADDVDDYVEITDQIVVDSDEDENDEIDT